MVGNGNNGWGMRGGIVGRKGKEGEGKMGKEEEEEEGGIKKGRWGMEIGDRGDDGNEL